MGLLEDAIREHLDLKRKHGATEEEVDRQEAEALGPARRAMAPADQADQETEQVEGAPAGVAEPGDVDVEAEPGEPMTGEEQVGDETVAYDAFEAPGEEALEPPGEGALEPPPAGDEDTLEPPAFLRPSDDAPAFREDVAEPPAFTDEPPDDVAKPPGPVEEPPAPGDTEVREPHEPEERDFPSDTPARGFEPVEDEGPPEAEHGEDEPEEDDADVLEDTPDFLQETPEHDRLWFEQKPPRDFDFD